MLAARGLREDDEGKRKHRIEGEYLVAVRRQAIEVVAMTAVTTLVLLAMTWALTLP